MPNQSFDHALGTLEQWARERGIWTNGTVEGQAKKTIEEAEEILDALRHKEATEQAMKSAEERYDQVAYEGARENNADAIRELEDALGDTGVAWIMCCICAGRDPVEMLHEAIIQIRDRRGHMGADGIFHKDQ